ncbi:MAG TPA: amino acid adenylation domain-containing protein [Opitutaceae bacterium]|nr:amino acid adenylation domain-containing protein [Opitutaceae bacterium]
MKNGTTETTGSGLRAALARVELPDAPADAALLPLQQSMALAHRLSGSAGLDLEQLVWRMRPAIPTVQLEAAWGNALRRHEALRISFSLLGGGAPRQRVESDVTAPLREVAVPGEEAGRDAALERFLDEDRRIGVDLTAAPAWRLTLLRFAPDDAALVWTFPHALLDGRSVSLILEQVATWIAALRAGRALVGEAAGVWLERYLQWRTGLDHRPALEWWAGQLGEFAGPARFPSDPAAPAERTCAQEMVLGEAAMAPVLAAAARLGVTPNTFCQAAWALVLASQSGQRDVVFGAVRACRRHGERGYATLAGMLMNSVPVRAPVPPEQRVGEFLGELRRRQVEARDWELAPLEEIQRAAGIQPGDELCSSVLMVDRERVWARAAALLGEGHRFSLLERPSFPVTLSVAAGPRLEARLMARGGTLGEESVDRVLRQFLHVLQVLPRQPEARLGELDLLPPEEHHRNVSLYNATAAPFPEAACLHHAFEAQADAIPSRPAVIGPDGTLTYGELERRANQIAHHLIALGAPPGGLVVVRLEKTTQLAAALYGVLKAGCGYVPVDPAWPDERFRFIVESTVPAAVITTGARLTARFERTPLVLLDRDRALLESAPSARPPRRGSNADPAYIIFTSGSTGVPKGVVIGHQGAVNTIADCNARFRMGAADRVFGISSCTFDLSVYDLFGPLAAGGAVVLCPAKDAQDPDGWSRLVRQHGVTIWNSVPQLVEMLVESQRDRAPFLASLRLVMMSGDWIPVGLPERARALLPQAELWSLGGATEASIWSIWRPIHRVDPAWPSIPYGRPMANQSFYVLDEQLRPSPTLVPGDLYIGGIGLAQGYWADPERTAAAFFVHPRYGRLYRTGDRGRFLPSGEIEFLGRRDHRVKLGGFRIELGEIEQVVSRLPWVRECLVTKSVLGAGAEALVAYIVPREGSEFDAEAVREYLAAKLPRYMVPSFLIKLERLPLNSNGKVDRSALPVLAQTQPKAKVAWTPAEERMAALWEEVLGFRPDSPDRSFFECGGNSLLSFRLIELIKRKTGGQLRPGRMFETRPTVRSMAREALAAGPAAPASASAAEESDRPRWLVQVRSYGSKPPFFFIGQYLDVGRFFSPDQPFYGVLLGFEIRNELPSQSFAEIAATILKEIRRVQPHGPYYLGGYCFGAVLAFEIALQLREQGEAIAYFCMVEASAPSRIGPSSLSRRERLAYTLSQIRQRFLPAPVTFVTKALGRVLDNGRLWCLGLYGERPFADFRPRRYDGPIDLFVCSEGPYRYIPAKDPRLAWEKWCARLRVDEVPGNHITMLREPLIRSLGPQMDERLRQAQAAQVAAA